MEHESGSILPFIVLVLALGAGIRHLLRRTPIPYTVALLFLGLLLGYAERSGLMINIWPELSESIAMASSIEPHLILFVFLPTLIFESAFAMDVHIFKRTFVQAFILAVPGLLLSTLLLGAIVKFMFSGSWDWYTALMFGAIISATDPVAVVAILREMGTGRELATLIEGESLLNDGTAIVVFILFYIAITTSATLGSPLFISGQFLYVSVVGPLIGVLIAYITIVWVRHVFNDAMIEITVTIVAAYLAYFLAENLLHVSGVLAVVAVGLLFSSIGRTFISHEVEEFLHRFWEMMAYLLNTLIFVIVGVVIANKTQLGTQLEWLILFYLYIGIHLTRAVMIMLFYPLFRRIGYGINWKSALVLTWSGLRGAVGLALALVVAQNHVIPEKIGADILFLCAGLVVLTLTINGTTIGWLLHRLGMYRILPARLLMLANATRQVHKNTEETLALLKHDRFLRGADWERVRGYLPDISVASGDRGNKTTQFDLAAETRRRILFVEKRSYWRQHHEGLLSPEAVRHLVESVDQALDFSQRLNDREDLKNQWSFSPLFRKLNALPWIGHWSRYFFYGRLAQSYDLARGFVIAQEETSSVVNSMVENRELVETIKSEIHHNREVGLKALTSMRDSFPEITIAIETRTAIRSVLNHERHTIQKMMAEGLLDEGEATKMIDTIEARMKKVIEEDAAIEPPSPQQLLREIPWLSTLDGKIFKRVLEATTDYVYAPGEELIREGDPSDRLCVIARGTVKV